MSWAMVTTETNSASDVSSVFMIAIWRKPPYDAGAIYGQKELPDGLHAFVEVP